VPAAARLASDFSPRQGHRLRAINLMTALLRSGFMPFLSLFLYERGLESGSIGLVMGFGSAVQLAAMVPGGLLIDHMRGRSVLLSVVGVLLLASSFCLMRAQGMVQMMAAVGGMSLAEALIVPAVLVINLESAGPGVLAEHVGRFQALGHVGRATGLLFSGMIGAHFGFPALIWFESASLAALLGVVWVSHLPAPVPTVGKGASHSAGGGLVLLGVALGLFQIGNAVLPVLLGLSLAEEGGLNRPLLAANIAMVAQIAMVVGSLLAAPALRRWGSWRVLAGSFAILPLRCACAGLLPASMALVPVECLHGLGEALQMVTIAGVIGDLYSGSGRSGTRFGCVMLLQGLGVAISPVVGGYVAQRWNGPVACAMLGVMGLLALGFWVLSRPYITKMLELRRLGLA
jgi:MFS family permease